MFFDSHRRRIRALELDMEYVMAAIDDLKAQSADTIATMNAAVSHITDISNRLQAALATNNDAELVAISADLKAATDSLKAITV